MAGLTADQPEGLGGCSEQFNEFLEPSACTKSLMLVVWNQTTQLVCMTLVTRAAPQQQRRAPPSTGRAYLRKTKSRSRYHARSLQKAINGCPFLKC